MRPVWTLLALALAGCGPAVRLAALPAPAAAVPAPAKAAEAPAEPALWTLADCLARARAENHSLRQAMLAVEQARSGIALARSGMLPHLDAMVRGEHRSNDPGANFNGKAQVTGDRDTGIAEVALIQPLWDSGNAFAQMRAGRARLEATVAAGKQARLDLDRAVVDAAVAYQDAQRLLDLLRDTRGTLEGQVRVASDRRANGLAGAEEVLSAELARNQRDQDILTAGHAVELARCVLNRLLARPLAAPLALAELPAPAAWVAGIADPETAALAGRPDVRAAAHAVAAAEAEVRVAQSGFWPYAGVRAAWNATTDDHVLNQDWWTVGIGMQLNLTDGGATMARVDGARVQLRSAREREAEVRDAAALAARRAALAWEEASRREQLAAEAVRLAEENLRISLDRYRQGLITATDLALEEERRTRARTSQLRNHAESVAAAMALATAVGRSLDELEATP